jgi:hypothetical protein
MAPQTTQQPTPTLLPAPDPYRDLMPFVATAQNPWDQGKVAHLLRRAGFGARPEEIPPLIQMGMDRAVDQLLAVTTTGLQESGRWLCSGATTSRSGPR